uniref:phenylalanine--tRNA ligase n=1 Tax=Palpitomonas bilix TaxID=652834 RepID=A0A7S3D5Q2_9EUKA
MEATILNHLNEKESIADSSVYAKEIGEDHQVVVGTLKSLASDNFVVLTMTEIDSWSLTAEGDEYAEKGAPEAIVYHAVPEEGMPQKDLVAKLGQVGKVGFGAAMKKKWIVCDKAAGQLVKKACDSIEDTVQKQLVDIKSGAGEDVVSSQDRQALKKRKLVTFNKVKVFAVEKGPSFSLERKKPETDLTKSLLSNNAYKDATFKPYNFDALAPEPDCGYLHPLLKVRQEYREIFLEMGFEEMPTRRYVESSFWNFDALFQPQQHPARDAHDTFFLTDPADCRELPDDYLERVKTTHETGGYGSIGYRYDWKVEEAKKNVLRTHTTAISSQVLYNLAQEYKETGVWTPKRFFSIDRVFRNETLDATHLAEFHQVEGIIIDKNITLGDLIGTLDQFFRRLGITRLRFKPAYNPYTEPSMEIFSYHDGLKKWVEVGNSGMFRPEMLEPMGLPQDVRAIAWGLSVERPTMILYKISNIRDLFGHKTDLQMIKESAICRLDKLSDK